MRKFRCFCLSALLLGQLSGCALFTSTALLVASVPGTAGTGKADLSGYSLGPISSDEAEELILSAVPAIEGEVYFTGRATWTGLWYVKQPRSQLRQSIVAITDLQILFMWWRESDERYEILIRLPYSEIYSVDLSTYLLGGVVIWFCHESNEVLIADQVDFIDRNTSFYFLKSGSSGWADKTKTKEAFQLLNKKVMPKEGSEQLPSHCEEDVDIGFGQDPLTG